MIYLNFCDKHLKHLPLGKLEDLAIWSIWIWKLPYDGYLPVKLEFVCQMIGQPEISDILAIMANAS